MQEQGGRRRALPQHVSAGASDVEHGEGDGPGGLPLRQRVDALAAAGRQTPRHGVDPRGTPAHAQWGRALLRPH